MSELQNAEIILTFAVDSLIDYLSERDVMQRTLETLGIQLSKSQIRSAKEEVDWRRGIQFMLHDQIYKNSGAKYYTPFFIRSKDAHRDYWLIHLSNHARARDVMVGLHWAENNSFAHFGRAGLAMLGYDQDNDFQITRQPMLPTFEFDAGARVATTECLLSELPERLYGFRDGIAFKELFAGLTNETPATSELVKVALEVMQKESAIEIRDKTGLVKRVAGVQRPTDIITPSIQRRLFIP
jgi:hypothetical protein